LVKSKKIAHLPWAVSKNMLSPMRNKIQSILADLKNTKQGRRILGKAQLTGLNIATDAEYDPHRRIIWEVANENYCIRNCDYLPR